MNKINMTNFNGRRSPGVDYSVALRDLIPGLIGEGMEPKSKMEIAEATGRNFETVTRLFQKIDVHIAGWRRGKSGEPSALWLLGKGEDAPRPGPLTCAEKNKRYRSTEHGWKKSRAATDAWKKSENGKKAVADYNAVRLARYHARKEAKKTAYAVLKQADPLMAAIMGVRA
jgi:hypothetical protein